MNMKQGERVVCVKPTGSLELNEIYTIIWIGFDYFNNIGVRVKEAKSRRNGFYVWRFREIKTDWVEELLEKISEEHLKIKT